MRALWRLDPVTPALVKRSRKIYAEVRWAADEATACALAYRAAGGKRQAEFEGGRWAAFVTMIHLLHDHGAPRECDDAYYRIGHDLFAGVEPRERKPQEIPAIDETGVPIERLRKSGYAAGEHAVSDRTTRDEALDIIEAIEGGVFEVPAPFSGELEHAWTPSRADALAGVPLRPEDPDAYPEIAAWEDAYAEGFLYAADLEAAHRVYDGPNTHWTHKEEA